MTAPRCRLHGAEPTREAVQTRNASTVHARVSAGRRLGLGRVPPGMCDPWFAAPDRAATQAPRDRACPRLPIPHRRYPRILLPGLAQGRAPRAPQLVVSWPRVGSQDSLRNVSKWLLASGALEQGAECSRPSPSFSLSPGTLMGSPQLSELGEQGTQAGLFSPSSPELELPQGPLVTALTPSTPPPTVPSPGASQMREENLA